MWKRVQLKLGYSFGVTGYGLYKLMGYMANGVDWMRMYACMYVNICLLFVFWLYEHMLAMAMAKEQPRHRGQLIENTYIHRPIVDVDVDADDLEQVLSGN